MYSVLINEHIASVVVSSHIDLFLNRLTTILQQGKKIDEH